MGIDRSRDLYPLLHRRTFEPEDFLYRALHPGPPALVLIYSDTFFASC